MVTEQRTYIAAIWQWLRDAENRRVIAWIGSGLIVLFGAVIFQNVETGGSPAEPSQKATADTGMATVGDVEIGGDVTIGDRPQDDVESLQK